MTKPILTQYDPDAEDYVEVLPKDENKAMQQVLNKQTPTPKKRKEHASSLQLHTDNPGGRLATGVNTILDRAGIIPATVGVTCKTICGDTF